MSRFRVFFFTSTLKFLLVFYRERFISILPKKAIYSKQSGPSLACLPAKCHFAGGGCAMIAQHWLLAEELRIF